MKKLILISLGLIILSTNTKAANKYNIGDKLYLWAKSGLNLRSGPGTSFDVIEKLRFGEEIEVKAFCSKTFNIKCISKTESNYYSKQVEPLILKGNWVKVISSDGKIGFLIDQYLLYAKPENVDKPFLYDINLRKTRIDTLHNSQVIKDRNGLNLSVKHRYLDGIEKLESTGGNWGETCYVFPNYSIEEVLILLSSSWRDFEGFSVLRNWKQELMISDGEICVFTIKLKKNMVIVNLECSC